MTRLFFANFALLVLAGSLGELQAADIDEFKVKRQEVFEFTEKPAIQRDGDRVIIRFTSKALCDATVAIEDASGRIVRHLASGDRPARSTTLCGHNRTVAAAAR